MKIAFHSLNCLFDPVSGAAMSVRTQLEGLAARGHEVHSVTAACFDSPDHQDEGNMLTSVGFDEAAGCWQRVSNGVTHTAQLAGASGLADLKYDQLAHSARSSLDVLDNAAPGTDNLFPLILDAVKVGVTVGEICERLYFGRH